MKKWNLLIEKKAQTALETIGYLGGAVDVYEIANSQNITIVEHDFRDGKTGFINEISGTLVIKNGIKTIGVNTHHSEHRMRFTIAHELGHFFLKHHMDEGIILDTGVLYRDAESSKGEKKMEIEANSFAAALLMPRGEVVNEFKSVANTYDDMTIIDTLVEHFNVSPFAMSIRLNRLNLMNTDRYIF